MRAAPLRRIPIAALFLAALSAAPAGAYDTLIVANKAEGTVWLLDPATGETRAKLPTGGGPHEAAASPDGRTAVICNYGERTAGSTLTVVDVEDGEVVRTVDLSPHARPHGIRYLDDRHVLVTSETSAKLLKVDVVAAEIVATYDAGGGVHMVDLGADRATAFATAIPEGRLCRVRLDADGEDARCVDTGTGTEALAVRPGGREVWVGSNAEHVVRVVDVASWEVVAEIECGLQPIRLAFTRNGRNALASCILTGDLAVIDADARKIVRRVKLAETSLDESDWRGRRDDEIEKVVRAHLPTGARPIGVLPGPDGRWIYVANRGLDHVAVVDTDTWEVVRRLPTGDGPDGMAFSRIAD